MTIFFNVQERIEVHGISSRSLFRVTFYQSSAGLFSHFQRVACFGTKRYKMDECSFVAGFARQNVDFSWCKNDPHCVCQVSLRYRYEQTCYNIVSRSEIFCPLFLQIVAISFEVVRVKNCTIRPQCTRNCNAITTMMDRIKIARMCVI